MKRMSAGLGYSLQLILVSVALASDPTLSPRTNVDELAPSRQDDLAIPPMPVDASAATDDAALPAAIVSQQKISPTSQPSPSKPAAPKVPPQPWKLCFFDNDFSYKKDPNHTPLFGENLKDVPLGSILPYEDLQETRVSVGGEIRWRFMDEVNRLRPPYNAPGRSV